MFEWLSRLLKPRKRAWVEPFQADDGDWHVRLVGLNGEKMMLSESYASHANAQRSADGLVGLRIERRPLSKVTASRMALALALVMLFCAAACHTPARVEARAFAPRPAVDVSRDQMRERALDLHAQGLIHRDQIPDREKQACAVFSSAQTGLPVYPFALFITTPPTSAHPGTFPVPIDGGNYVHRFKLRLEYLQVGSWFEPYQVCYLDHGTGTFSVISSDTNEVDLVGLPQ